MGDVVLALVCRCSVHPVHILTLAQEYAVKEQQMPM